MRDAAGGGTGSKIPRFLIPSQQAHLAGERAAPAGAEGQVIRRIDIVIDGVGIVTVRDVIKAGTQLPPKSKQRNPPFERHVERKIGGKTRAVGTADQLLVFIHHAERKALAPVERVGKIELLQERQDSPGDNPVGGVPWQRARALWTEIGIE